MPIIARVAAGRYEEVIRLEDTLCELKRQFQCLQLKDVDKEHSRQRVLYKAAQKVIKRLLHA